MGIYPTLYLKWQPHTTIITVAAGGDSTATLPWQQLVWMVERCKKTNKQTKTLNALVHIFTSQVKKKCFCSYFSDVEAFFSSFSLTCFSLSSILLSNS